MPLYALHSTWIALIFLWLRKLNVPDNNYDSSQSWSQIFSLLLSSFLLACPACPAVPFVISGLVFPWSICTLGYWRLDGAAIVLDDNTSRKLVFWPSFWNISLLNLGMCMWREFLFYFYFIYYHIWVIVDHPHELPFPRISKLCLHTSRDNFLLEEGN